MPLTDDQKQQLVDVYKRAETSGDAAAMERVRSALAADAAPPQQAAPAQPPSMDQAYQSQARAAQAQGQTSFGKVAGMLPEGIARSPRRLAEGASQLLRFLTAADPEKDIEVNARRQGEVMDMAQRYQATPGQADAALLGGEMVGGLPAGGIVGTGARTARGAAGLGAAGGAISSIFEFDPTATDLSDRFANAAIATTAGGILGAAPNANLEFPAIRNFFVRAIEKQQQGESGALLAQVTKAFPEAQLSLAQSTGSTTVRQIQNHFQGNAAQTFYKQQQDENLRIAGELIGAPSSTARSGTKQIQQAIKTNMQRAQIAASNAYENGIDEAIKATRRMPAVQGAPRALDPQIVPVDGVREAFRKEFGELIAGGTETASGYKLTKNMHKVYNDLLARGDQALTLEDANNILKVLSAAQRGGVKLVEDGEAGYSRGAAGRLMGAMGAALDEVPDSAGDAVKILRQTRSDYKQFIQQRDELKARALIKVFGKKEMPGDPTEALNILIRQSPEAQKESLEILREIAPDTIRMFEKQIFRSAKDAALNKSAAAQASMFNAQGYLNALPFDEALVSSPFFSQATQKKARDFHALLRLQLNDLPAMPSGKKVLPDPENVMMTFVSLAPEFIMRNVAKAVGGTSGDKLFFTKEGIELLKKQVNTLPVNRPALLNILQRIDSQGVPEEENGNPQP